MLVSALAANAQKIHFTDTGNVWKQLEPQYNAPGPFILNYSTFSYVGDTLLSAKTYRNFNFRSGFDGLTNAYVREDTGLKKVFVRASTSDSEWVLYDYNLVLGDTFTTTSGQFVVCGIDSTQMDGMWYRVWHFPPLGNGGIYGNDTICIIEGIGCIEHPTYMFWDYTGCVECSEPQMFCFSHNGATPPLAPSPLWLDNSTSCVTYPKMAVDETNTHLKHLDATPNPADNLLHIVCNDLGGTVAFTVFDMLGRPMLAVQAATLAGTGFNLGIGSLPDGTYILQAGGNDEGRIPFLVRH